jgi:hypothetical protein
MWLETPIKTHWPRGPRERGFLLSLCVLLLAVSEPPQANGSELPQMCSVETTQSSGQPPSHPSESSDCYEFGASIGELGWNWRKKLPSQVRWVVRKDAPILCGKLHTEFGQKVQGRMPEGCIFLAPEACTIVTPGPISPASIGNAVRDCVP